MSQKPLHIAFEISPILTASGTFGDKSGVFRYIYGMVSSVRDYLKIHNPKSKIYLFSFAPEQLAFSVCPEILSLLDDEMIEMVGYEKKLKVYARCNSLFDLFDIPKVKVLLKAIDKTFGLRKAYMQYRSSLTFKKYVKHLETFFKKNDVSTVFHSETGFFPLSGVNNVMTVYDLTTLLVPGLHRTDTINLQERKIKFARKYADAVLAISESTKRDLESYSPIFQHKPMMVAYPGLDPAFSSETGTVSFQKIEEVVRQFHMNLQPKKYLLFYSTFEPRKNLPYIVRSFTDLITSGQIPADFKLVLIGGAGWGDIKKLVHNFISENFPIKDSRPIVQLDFVVDAYLKSFIRNAYACVYPSFYEGFGLPVLESMALGTPVITSDNSSLPEVGGDAVVYVNPKDYFDVRAKMQHLINHPDESRKLADKGLVQSQKFKWDLTAAKLHDFILSLERD